MWLFKKCCFLTSLEIGAWIISTIEITLSVLAVGIHENFVRDTQTIDYYYTSLALLMLWTLFASNIMIGIIKQSPILILSWNIWNGLCCLALPAVFLYLLIEFEGLHDILAIIGVMFIYHLYTLIVMHSYYIELRERKAVRLLAEAEAAELESNNHVA